MGLFFVVTIHVCPYVCNRWSISVKAADDWFVSMHCIHLHFNCVFCKLHSCFTASKRPPFCGIVEP